jgi:hypothetical protein
MKEQKEPTVSDDFSSESEALEELLVVLEFPDLACTNLFKCCDKKTVTLQLEVLCVMYRS